MHLKIFRICSMWKYCIFLWENPNNMQKRNQWPGFRLWLKLMNENWIECCVRRMCQEMNENGHNRMRVEIGGESSFAKRFNWETERERERERESKSHAQREGESESESATNTRTIRMMRDAMYWRKYKGRHQQWQHTNANIQLCAMPRNVGLSAPKHHAHNQQRNWETNCRIGVEWEPKQGYRMDARAAGHAACIHHQSIQTKNQHTHAQRESESDRVRGIARKRSDSKKRKARSTNEQGKRAFH